MSDPAELFNQALRALELGKTELAIDRLARVVSADPGDAEAVSLLVDLYQADGDGAARAEELLLVVSELVPEEPAYKVRLGELRLARGAPKAAAAALKQALLVQPGSWEALCLLGDAFADVGAWGEAVKVYQLSLESNPFAGETWFNLAVALTNADREAEAAEAWRGYLRCVPDASDRAEVEARVARLEEDEEE